MMARGGLMTFVILMGASTTFAVEPAGANRSSSNRPSKAARNRGNVTLVVQQTPVDSSAPASPPTIASGPIQISDGEPGTAPVVNCSEPHPGVEDTSSCSKGLLAKICPKLNRPKTPYDPLQCGTFCSHWRFALGSCRAFFEDGRFEPKYPGNCPCGK